MIPDEIRCAMIRRMYTDRIFVDSQWADDETIARQSAIPRGQEEQARDLLAEMAGQSTCPVVGRGRRMYALKRDRDGIRSYLRATCLRKDDIPWELRK